MAFHQSENSESLCGGAAFARPDYDRAMRQGAGEVIYGEGKTAEQIAAIASSLMEAGQPRVLATRVDAKKADAVAALWGDGGGIAPCVYYETARLVVFGDMPAPDGDGVVAIACAGTSDLPVAEEARSPRSSSATRCGASTMWAWRASIGSWMWPTSCARPESWWRWPAWRARSPPWWGVLSPRR